MKKTILIPTYWGRKKEDGWIEGDAVYDHATPIDEEGTLARTLESMRLLHEQEYSLVILVCPTASELEDAALKNITKTVSQVNLGVQTYIFTPSILKNLSALIKKGNANGAELKLLNMNGYANVRNMCILAAEILHSDVAILIDDDEVFEDENFVEKSVEFLGKRVYGDVVHGIAGYYLNKEGHYYDDVKLESWMTYWNRFGCKAKAFDEIIGCSPRIKRTPFAFGGAMILHKDLFRCVPFDPYITRGEDIDYLINSKMYGFSFFLDNTLSIKHLPEAKKHPEWKRLREDIYRFVYEKAKLTSQYKTSNMVEVSANDFNPYPGEFLNDDLEDKIFRSNLMLALKYLSENDVQAANEAMNNIMISKGEAIPSFDAFSRYRTTQKQWDKIMNIVAGMRFELRNCFEQCNVTANTDYEKLKEQTEYTHKEIKDIAEKLFYEAELTEEQINLLIRYITIKTYGQGESIFEPGDENEGMFIIVKGEIVLSTKDDDGTLTEVARIKKGEMIGETSLIFDKISMSGKAAEYTEMIGLKKEVCRKVNSENPAIGIKLMSMMLKNAATKMRNVNAVLKEILDKNIINDNYIE